MTVRIIEGDCLEVMPTLEAEGIDAIVTDPPYGLGFMGKAWDHGVPGVPFWVEALRVAKPGAHLLAFGGTRTFHRLACAIEDAGFEIQDTLCWLFGSGFPKHKSKLKPAYEPIIMARKPAPRATPLNIESCRIGAADTRQSKRGGRNDFPHEDDSWEPRAIVGGSASGRWPANVVLDEEAAAILDAQSGTLKSGAVAAHHMRNSSKQRNGGGYHGNFGDSPLTGFGDSGGASRFFYTAKASRSEREAGLEGRSALRGVRTNAPRENEDAKTPSLRNHHPCVKPLALMRWLCRLVTPPNGLILDPFTGSGSTGRAAVLEGFRFVGIEKEPEYAEIARKRIEHCGAQGTLAFEGIA